MLSLCRQTDGWTDIWTDRQTTVKQYAPDLSKILQNKNYPYFRKRKYTKKKKKRVQNGIMTRKLKPLFLWINTKQKEPLPYDS